MIKNFFKIFKTIFYEIKSEFVFEEVKYRIDGNCSKCGDCCRFMYSLDTYTEKEFKILTFLYPKYKRFKIIGKDEKGNLIFACRLIGETNLCPDHKNRLKMCRDYPNPNKIRAGGKLYKRCTYKLLPNRDFNDYLNR